MSRYSVITFKGHGGKTDQSADKVSHAVLTNRVSSFGPPGIISTDKESVFLGAQFSRFVTKTLLARGNARASSKLRSHWAET